MNNKTTFQKLAYNIQRPFTNPIYKDIRALGADSAFNGLQIGSMIGTGLGLLGGLGEFTNDLVHGDFNPSSLVIDPIETGALGALTGSSLGALYGSLIRKTGDEDYDKRLNAKRKLFLTRLGRVAKYSTIIPAKTGFNYMYSGAQNLSSKLKEKYSNFKASFIKEK